MKLQKIEEVVSIAEEVALVGSGGVKVYETVVSTMSFKDREGEDSPELTPL
jgi:hypothetical protein